MQSMRTQMNDMDAEERAMWERGEKGNWRVICGMMDRARATLVSAREAAQGIVRFLIPTPCPISLHFVRNFANGGVLV